MCRRQFLSGKLLYKDIWYPYGPLAPYVVAFFFGVFGVHLNTLYCLGLTLVLAYSVLLLALARRLGTTSFSLVVVLCFFLQAFQPTMFNFVLPYSYAAAFGSFLSMLSLYCLVVRLNGESRLYLYGSGMAIGMALLTKLEFGIASLLSYFFYITCEAMGKRSLKAGLSDIVPVLPGLTVAALGYGLFVWKISLSFLLQENLQFSGSYLNLAKRQGFSLGLEQICILGVFLLVSLAVWAAIARGLQWSFKVHSSVAIALLCIASIAILVPIVSSNEFQQKSSLFLSFLAFPTGMYWLCPIVLVSKFGEVVES